ncbi:MAG: NAD(P)-dependent oxidoreductase [Chitinophagales bacterium]|jgi:putative NADH-flavin reductase
MKIILFGATGYSGRAILAEALQQGYEVTVLVRNASKIQSQHPNLTIVEGDVLDESVVASVLKHQEVVIQCLGIGGKGDGKPSTFISDATKIMIDEMKKQQVHRLIAISNVGAGNSVAFQPWFFTNLILPYFMKWLKVIIEDKNRMEAIIMNSELNWTIVRCPNIVDKSAKGTVTATLDGKDLKLSVTLTDMAAFIVNQIRSSSFSRQAPSISN